MGPHVEAAREVFELRNLCAVGEALHQQAVSTVRVRLAVPGVLATDWQAASIVGPLVEAAREVFELRNLCAADEAAVRLAVPWVYWVLLGEQRACWVLMLRQRARSSSCATSVQ